MQGPATGPQYQNQQQAHRPKGAVLPGVPGGRTPGQQNAIVLGILGVISIILLTTVIVIIATDSGSSRASGDDQQATKLDARDQSLYDDGRRAGIEWIDATKGVPAEDDPEGLCNELMNGGQSGSLTVASSARVDLYDYDDRVLWITGCVEAFQAG